MIFTTFDCRARGIDYRVRETASELSRWPAYAKCRLLKNLSNTGPT